MLLALDQSIRISGYSIFKEQELVSYGHWSVPSSLPLGQRLHMFLDHLDELNEKYEIDRIAFEDIQMQRGNVETYKKLCYTQAMIIFWCEKHKVQYDILSPSHWRSVIKRKCGKAFGRKREEQKLAAQEFVKEKYNIEATEDEADAISLGTAAILEQDKDTCAF